jgi:hypothetical protein
VRIYQYALGILLGRVPFLRITRKPSLAQKLEILRSICSRTSHFDNWLLSGPFMIGFPIHLRRSWACGSPPSKDQLGGWGDCANVGYVTSRWAAASAKAMSDLRVIALVTVP